MMGNELLRIADGFSMVADGLRGLAGMEWNGAVDMAEKDAAVPGSAGAVDTDGNAEAATESGAAGVSDAGKGQKAGKEDKKAAGPGKEKAVAIEDVRAVMAQKTQEGKSQEIKDLLQKYGAVKLSAVDPAHYPALLKEAKVL